jgi:hypothetical protein
LDRGRVANCVGALAGRPLDNTRFGRIAEERLGVNLISARSPQAKGRIERPWGTLQNRLPVWLKHRGIADMNTEDKAIGAFIQEYNARFAVEVRSGETSFVPLDGSNDLDRLLSVRYERTTDNANLWFDGCFSFQNFLFQVESKKPAAKKKVQFLFSEKIGLKALADKECFPVTFQGMSRKGAGTHIPDVVKLLIEKNYYADSRVNPKAAWRSQGGEIFACY